LLPGYADGGMVGRVSSSNKMLTSNQMKETNNATSITQNFSIVAPQGTVPNQTQQQIAAAAARGIAVANRRNN